MFKLTSNILQFIDSVQNLCVVLQVNRNRQLGTVDVLLFSGKMLHSIGSDNVEFFMLISDYRF
jgi:hypothetical protein